MYLIEHIGDDIKEYLKKGEQAAHEAIRPTNINEFYLGEKFDQKDKLLYRMIWVRAVASLMEKEKCNQYTITIPVEKYWFNASYLQTIFLGFKILYEKTEVEKNSIIMQLNKNDILVYDTIESKQFYTEPPKRYTESSLVQELEKKGIGRPSTYANIITTVQKRNYVLKKNSTITKKECIIYTLKGNITSKTIEIEVGDKKQRLYPTDLGIQVTSFLVNHIGHMMDYNFTSNLENELDDISNGNKNWIETLDFITNTLSDLIDNVPTMEKIKINRVVGKYNKCNMEFFLGKYGPFIKYKKKCYSLPKEYNEFSSVTPEIAIASIEKEKTNVISYDCSINNKEGTLQALKGPYGNYLKFIPLEGKPTNYSIKKEIKDLTLEQCLELIKKKIRIK